MNPDDVQKATCTQLPQVWGKTGSSTLKYLYDPIPISKFCHFPMRKPRLKNVWPSDVPEAILAKVKSIIYEGTVSIHSIFRFPYTVYERLTSSQRSLLCGNHRRLLLFQELPMLCSRKLKKDEAQQ